MTCPPQPTPPLAKQFTGLFCSAESQGARENKTVKPLFAKKKRPHF